ncbi:sugar phosphate isomerase/epimerase [Paenibacillus sp. P25]|nr:sugar phosphate isomerase/epimerase [Paenibacillus sp. P25]
MFLRNLEFAYLIGAEVLVYHSGIQLPSDECRSMDKLIEREELHRLAIRAKELWVQISVENHNPQLRDKASNGNHKYGQFLGHLLELVRIDHPNVGICLDYGFSYLSANISGSITDPRAK